MDHKSDALPYCANQANFRTWKQNDRQNLNVKIVHAYVEQIMEERKKIVVLYGVIKKVWNEIKTGMKSYGITMNSML